MKFNRTVRTLLMFLFIAGLSQGAFAQKFEINPYAGYFWPAKVNEFKLQEQGIWGLRGGVFVSDRLQIEGNFGYLNHFKYENANVSDVIVLSNVTVVTIKEYADNMITSSGQVVEQVEVTEVTVRDLDPSSVTIIAPDAKQRGYQWDANASYHFFNSSTGKFAPYLTIGIGGTTVTRNDETAGTAFIDSTNLTPDEHFALTQVLDQRIAQASALIPAPINEGTYFTINYGGGIKSYRMWGPVGLRADFIGRNLPNFGGGALNAFQLTGGLTIAWGER